MGAVVVRGQQVERIASVLSSVQPVELERYLEFGQVRIQGLVVADKRAVILLRAVEFDM